MPFNARSFARLTVAVLAASLLLVTPALAGNPERNAYYGETHQHTSWSVDAWLFGNHVTGPADALDYAKGKPIKHPLGYEIRIETPLDFMGVTDHSEYVGVTKMANTPGSELSKLPQAQPLILKDPNNPADVQKVFMALVKVINEPPIKAFMSPKIAGTIWKENVEIADKANEPGEFTAFCSYEFTSQHDFRNLHRNVFFRDCAKVPPMPFSALDSWHPEDLWKWMDGQRAEGNEVLAISHNANLSDGWMFPIDVDSYGRPIDAAWADARDRNERLTEMKQIKGQSETHPLLSPNDEFADYEIMSFLIGLPADNGRIAHIVGSYVRQAFKDGLTMAATQGYNPYKMGVAGGSDSHNTGAPYRQTNFYGGHGLNDGTIETRMKGHLFSGLDVRLENPAGLTGVWAEENTRASIWDAMHRKETFGTSGPRLKVRFFGGWGYSKDMLDDPFFFKKSTTWVKKAYEGGVPMGGDLPPAKSGEAPKFVVWAMKDPTSGNLDRIQIVKGWTRNGQSFEKAFDVAWSGARIPDEWTGKIPPVKSTVDIDQATYRNSVGAIELKTVWSDPEFDPSLHAFYYARVLEIPTPRWSTIQAHQIGIAPPDVVPATVQERAWSSPIWYTPSADARKKAKPGMTVTDLKSKGAKAMSNAELEKFIVGRAYWVTNHVTGKPTKLRYDDEGNQIALHVGRGVPLPSEGGALPRESYQTVPSPYAIENGKLVTMVANTPFELTLYKLGDKVYAARSNEFGYANYEFSVEGPENLRSLPDGDYKFKDQADFLHVAE